MAIANQGYRRDLNLQETTNDTVALDNLAGAGTADDISYLQNNLRNTSNIAYNSIDSNSGSFNIQFFTNENINISLHENSRKSMSFNFDLVSKYNKIGMLVLKGLIAIKLFFLSYLHLISYT